MRPATDSVPRLPGFATAEDALREALPTLNPPTRISVSAAAELYHRLDTLTYRGPWRNSVLPYMVEPADMVTSRRYTAAVFVGPARSGKTEGLIVNPIVHTVMCNPRLATVIHINRDSARAFSLEKIQPMIFASPEVRGRLYGQRGADNIFDKRFLGGTRLTIGWPVISQLSARDVPLMMLTDYDRMDDEVAEEGDPFSLARKRTQTFGSLGMTVVESSPGRPVLDPDWEPATPHEAPPTTGILALYNRGTRARRYWACPSCATEFVPDFDRLRWPEKASPEVAAQETVMVCPSGCIIEPADRNRLDRAGRWLHETVEGATAPIEDERVRPADIVSYWLPGPAAAFQDWGEMVQRYLEARAHLERTGDETPLKATVTLDQGKPFLSRAVADVAAMSDVGLRARAEDYPLRVAPPGTRFVTVQVDIQGRRFVVHVDAWGVGLERWLIQRLEIVAPPPSAPAAGERAIDPSRYAEDWEALFALLDLTVPVEGTEWALRPVAMAVDSAGEPGVTERAYQFWRTARSRGLAGQVRLVKGVGGLDRPRAVARYPETAMRGKSAVARDIPIVHVGTDRLKDEIAAALTRSEPGAGYYHLPSAIDDAVFNELVAERRTDKGWAPKIIGGRRNEALDLAVYGKALVIVKGAEKIDWTNPPDWAQPPDRNAFGVHRETGARGRAESDKRIAARREAWKNRTRQ